MSKADQLAQFIRTREELESKLDRARSLADIVYNSGGHRDFFRDIAESPWRDNWTPSQAVVDLMMVELRTRVAGFEKELAEHDEKINFKGG